MKKTNAMRLLDFAKIRYEVREYQLTEHNSFGLDAAHALGMSESQVFKTLVTRGDKNGVNVFCVPVNHSLDLKKAAAISHNKKIELILNKDVLSTTGYVVGGCSPVGMKKKYPTYLDQSALQFECIGISGGALGCELFINPTVLVNFVDGVFSDLIQIK